MKTLAVIPARYASTRFPGKPLVDIKGKTMIRRVFEQASAADLIDKVIVATDDQRIYDHVQGFGNVMMTGEHQSGTDRCGEIAERFPEYDTILNIQGDEPFVPPEMINELILFLKNSGTFKIGTLAKKINKSALLFDPNTVKVLMNKTGNGLYFSRQALPYFRNVEKKDWIKKYTYYKHIGLYIFERKTLLELVQLPESTLEKAERLEQLRWLQNGYSIGVGITEFESFGIDTPEDLESLLP